MAIEGDLTSNIIDDSKCVSKCNTIITAERKRKGPFFERYATAVLLLGNDVHV